MRSITLTLLLLCSACATARDQALPVVGEVLRRAHEAQAAAVDGRAAAKRVTELFCRAPLPETAAVCSEAERALLFSKDALNISADGLDAASKIYTEINDEVSK
jgi:hypothetical protein